MTGALVMIGLLGVPASAAELPTDCNRMREWHQGPVLRTGKPAVLQIQCSGFDLDPADLTFSIVEQPNRGQIGEVALSDSAFHYVTYAVEYIPDPTYVGYDFFTVDVSDGAASYQEGMSVQMGENSAPNCLDGPRWQHATVGQTVEMTHRCSDLDYQDWILGVEVTEPASRGHVDAVRTLDDDGYTAWTATYTPEPDFIGTDAYTVRVSDGEFTEDVVVHVNVADTPWCAEGAPVSVRAGMSVPVGLYCTHPSFRALGVRIVTPPTQGTALPSSTSPRFVYRSDPEASGTDLVNFQAYSDFGESLVTTQVMEVIPNAAPSCRRLGAVVPPDVAVTVALGCADVEDDPVTLATLRQPDHGTLSEIVDGQATYTPDAGFVGTDRFSYTGSDYARTSAPAVVRITVDDGKAPVLDLSIARGQSPRGVARHGLAYYSDNDEQITGELVATISGRTAKRLGLVRRASGPVRIAVDRSQYEYDTSVLGLLHLTDRAAEAIRPARRVPITLRFRGTDPLGNTSAVTVRRTLRR